MIMLPCVVSTVRIESTEALTVFFLVTKKRYSMLVTNGVTLMMFMIKSSSLSPLFSHSSTLLHRQLGRPLKQEVNKIFFLIFNVFLGEIKFYGFLPNAVLIRDRVSKVREQQAVGGELCIFLISPGPAHTLDSGLETNLS